ncbi:hypothetical protein [Nonomuraea soli]|uniref:Uncharacterized protein n=1 Tax=Nonomuraea soli TaxID=1032476 RepID=A0A7W0HP43_9ACTN|nr:hypothetical protein [Nonomuraea soli]MBA2890362.1 hypothetical protein [Nonomuraea soli]
MKPSQWQQRIQGEWVGRPSLFDATGTWQGYEDIRRSSIFEDGTTTYVMDGGLTGGGPLAGRFRLGAPFAFGVVDSDADRLYTGPDFHGSGRPYGAFVDAHYYGPGWQVGLNTWNQTIGDTQVYSSLLSQGPAIVGCFNGLYTRDAALVDEWLAAETTNGPVPYILPTKAAGAYSGVCEVYGADQKPRGTLDVSIEVEPVDLLRARHRMTLGEPYTTEVRRDGFRSFYEGPQVWGNAQAYGRASYPVLHLGGARRVHGREFMMDAAPGMGAGSMLAVVYEVFAGNRLDEVIHGVLTWSSS